MFFSDSRHSDIAFLLKPILSVIILAALSIGIFIFVYQHWMNSLFENVESMHRLGLVQIVSAARNSVEPLMVRMRSGRLGRAETLDRVRSQVRAMTYMDQYGDNYVFMSSYDGTMLVQPFEPAKEMTNQWDIRDDKGLYIIRELVKAAKEHPAGSFVRYHYFLPGVHETQEKLAYVVGLPELNCYIGTGMYMQQAIREQQRILANIKYGTIWLLIAVLMPVSAALLIILNRNRLLLTEISMRKKAEDAIKASRKQLDDILRAASEIAIIATEPDGIVTAFNTGSERMLGYSADEIIGRHTPLIFNTDDEIAEKCKTLTAELGHDVHGFEIFIGKAKLEGSQTGEWTYVRKDGSRLLVSLVVTAIRSESDEIAGYLGVAHDITRQKEAEKSLRENNERLRGITTNLPGVVYQFYARNEGEWGLSYVSGYMEELFEIQILPLDSLFARFTSHIHEEDRDRFMNSIRKSTGTASPWDFEGRYIRPSGDAVWFHGLSTPTRHPDRIIFDGLLLDITERKRAEEALRASEEKFRSIFENAPLTIAISDMDGRYLDVNARMCENSGVSREEIIGRRFGEIPQLSRYENMEDDERITRKLMEQGWISNEETRLIRPSSNECTTNLLFARLVSIGGQQCIISMVLDITERKRLEVQLIQAQKMESIGRLAGGVAHDFNNLLTAISGNTELALMNAGTDSKITSRLKVVKQAADMAAELTSQLLAFSRKQIIVQQVIDLGRLINDMVNMLTRMIGEDIRLETHTQKDLYTVKIDPTQIQQIVLNLAANARDAMPKGGTLSIETANVIIDEVYCNSHQYSLTGEHVMLAVTDTGIGMSKEAMQHLFEPFYTSKIIGKGTGLGLASVYGVVKQNDGTIDVFSEPGKGTCFRIYFPRACGEFMEYFPAIEDKSMPSGTGTILLVEDNQLVREFTRDVLVQLGYTVLTAGTAEEAVELARSRSGEIALLLTDVILPGMNGRQLADALKHEFPALKVLYASGYTRDTFLNQRVLEKDFHFISKPFSARDLACRVREVLEQA